MATELGRFSEAAVKELPHIPPVILARQLGLADEVMIDINQHYGHDEERSKLAVLHYWENNDPTASWQTLAEAVMRVDLYRSLGERIMSIHVNKSFTIEHVLAVLEAIDDWFELGYPLLKKSSSLRAISRNFPTDKCKQAVIGQWMEEDKQAGWESLATTIMEYLPNHCELAENIRSQYISEPLEKAVPENPPSPGLENPVSEEQALNLCSTISDWYALGWMLMLPKHAEQELEEIEHDHAESEDRLSAVFSLWKSKWPKQHCTWQWLASAIRKMPQDSHIADRIERKLSKGKVKYEIQQTGPVTVTESEPLIEREDTIQKVKESQPESGMELVGEKHFHITGRSQQHLSWEECGLRIHLPEGSLPENSTSSLSVYAVHSGPFLYPENSAPVSCIYYFKFSQPLIKSVVLELEHCWKVSQQDTPSLSFALASMSTGPPYQFELIDGGIFQPESRYGILHRKGFSSLIILEHVRRVISKLIGWPSRKRRRSSAEEDTTISYTHSKRNYVMRGYYGYKDQTQQWHVFIFVLRDLASDVKLAKKKVDQELSPNHYETVELQAIDLLNSEPYLRIGLQSKEEKNSSLSPLKEEVTYGDWSILPSCVPCQIECSTINQMDKRKDSLPFVKLIMEYIGSQPEGGISRITLLVKLLGTGVTPAPGIFVKLSYPMQWRRHSSRLSSAEEQCQFDPDNELNSKELEKYVVPKVDSKWKSLAIIFGLDENTIESINIEEKSNKDKLRRALHVWMDDCEEYKKWSDIFSALKKVGKRKLANSLGASYSPDDA